MIEKLRREQQSASFPAEETSRNKVSVHFLLSGLPCV